jgi:hypothetical protein
MSADSMVSGSLAADSTAQARSLRLLRRESSSRFARYRSKKQPWFSTASECAFIALNSD